MGWDVAVIGAGHNGLVAAALLARAGRRVVVLERRDRVGGACVTEERWPGYRVSRAAYVAGLVRPVVSKELDLARHGLRFLRRSPSSFTPLPDGRGLLLGGSEAETHASIAAFSRSDADRYPRYEAMLDRFARWIEPSLDAPAPDPGRLHARDLALLGRLGVGALRLGRELPRALALLLGPARPELERWFESEPLRATLATDAVIGAWAPPSAPGTGYVLFHHVMGETGGARGVWAYVEGGMGRFSEAIASAAREAGVEIRLESEVARIDVDGGAARGVTLSDGTSIEARCVVSGADPKRTFVDWVGPGALPETFAREVAGLDFRSGSVKVNLALDRLPRFRGSTQDGVAPEHHGTIHVGATTLDDLERAFQEAQAGRLPERPIVELTLPTALDASLAPSGHHIASLFVQWGPCDASAEAWDTLRDPLADRACALIDDVAPGFSDSVIHREVLAPPDLERIFGLTGGNLFHGAMTPDRLLSMRPIPGWARYATPIQDLYLCGAGTHPGGGVMGACGRNAAREILRQSR
ncbi:MAG: NAD(P)/FAD-dependent oxidoreductase [Myxococcota bacterium]